MRRYTITLVPDPVTGGYSVFVPALPSCVTYGPTVEACIERAREAIQLWIEDLEASGEPVPEEMAPVQTITIDVAA